MLIRLTLVLLGVAKARWNVVLTSSDVMAWPLTGATASAFTVYHRDLPEVRAEGETPTVAATHLVNALTRSLDTAQ